MKFTLNKTKFVFKLFLILLFLLVSSCSDKDKKPFVGKKVNIHSLNNSKASKNFIVKIDEAVENYLWTQKGGDDTHSIPNATLKFPIKKIFSINTDQNISDEYYILANPVVDKKNIYILNTNGKVISINKINFKINWQKQIFNDQIKFPNPGSIVVKVSNDELYVHNGGNLIFALDKKNGKPRWKFKNEVPFRGNITISNNYLLVNDYSNNLLAFRDKKLKWKKRLGQSESSIFTNIRPIIHKNKIINPAFNGLFHILNLSNGKLLFSDYLQPNKKTAQIFRNNDIIANPIISDEKIFIISHSGTLASYDVNNFKSLWSVQIGGGNTPIISGNSLFLLDNINILYSVNAANGKIKWIRQLDRNVEKGIYFKNLKKIKFQGPYLVDSKLILFSSNGFLNLIDPLTGKIIKSREFDLLGSEPIFVENKLIILTSDGDLKVYK